MADRAARRVLAAWLDRLRPVQEALTRARWDAACRATPPHREQVEAAARALDETLTDEVGIRRIGRSLAERIDDPILHRALSCLQCRLLPHRVLHPKELGVLEAELQEHFACFRAEVDGRRLAAHEVARILRDEVDTGMLERTWRAAIAVGTRVAERVREAARLRNAHARALGMSNHRALRLLAEEVDVSELDALLRDLEEGSDDAWLEEKRRLDERLAKRYGVSPGDLAVWHYGDVFLQSRPPDTARPDPFEYADPIDLMRRTFRGVGLDVEAALAASDLHPREGKNPHAFCTHIDRAGDVRVLANVVPSTRWTRTMLHEFGHAAYDLHLDFDLPWNLVRPPHACVTEGVAMLFERLIDDPVWRRRIADVPEDAEARAGARAERLTFVRWGLVVSRFEERLYADPDQDLDAVWWDLVERYQGIRRPDPLPPGAWAAKIHVACFPMYYYSYLLGECIASQFARHLSEGPCSGLVDDPDAGRWLVEEVFRPSATLMWRDLVQRATGSAPDAEALLADMVG